MSRSFQKDLIAIFVDSSSAMSKLELTNNNDSKIQLSFETKFSFTTNFNLS